MTQNGPAKAGHHLRSDVAVSLNQKRTSVDGRVQAMLERYTDPQLRYQEINELYDAYGKVYPLESFPPLLERKALELTLALFPERHDLHARLVVVNVALTRQWPLFAYRDRSTSVEKRAALDGVEAAIMSIDDPADRSTHAIAAFLEYVQIGRPDFYPVALQELALRHLTTEAARSRVNLVVGARLKHFVLTRLGLGVYQLPWYESILSLFEAVTYPSMEAQIGAHFIWLVVVDRRIPEPALRRLRNIVGAMSNLHIVSLDLVGTQHARHGSFDHVWYCCQEYILANRLLTDPDEYVITSSIDSDDALHRDALALVRTALEPEVERLRSKESSRSAIMRHTCGQVLSFPRGLRWFVEKDVVESFDHPFLGMGIFVLARFSSGIAVTSCDHEHWPAMAHALMFEIKHTEFERFMWVYVRHHRTQVGWQLNVAESDPRSAELLHADFGIDFDRLAQWRADPAYSLPGIPPDRHLGLSSREQHDRYFRLAALNRQIAALERKRQLCGTDDEDELLIMRQRQERIFLLEQFERGEPQPFG